MAGFGVNSTYAQQDLHRQWWPAPVDQFGFMAACTDGLPYGEGSFQPRGYTGTLVHAEPLASRADSTGSVPPACRWGRQSLRAHTRSYDYWSVPRLARPAHREIPRTSATVGVARGGRSRSRSKFGLENDARVEGSRDVELRGQHLEKDKGVVHQKASPEFGRVLRLFYSVIKTQHKLDNIEKLDSDTVAYRREVFASGPEKSNTVTSVFGESQARDLTLKQHYKDTLGKLEYEIRQYFIDEWQDAFQVAVRWTKKSLPKVTERTVAQAQERIINVYRDSPFFLI